MTRRLPETCDQAQGVHPELEDQDPEAIAASGAEPLWHGSGTVGDDGELHAIGRANQQYGDPEAPEGVRAVGEGAAGPAAGDGGGAVA